MQYSKFDMFFDKEALSSGITKASVLDFGFNRNMEDKIYLAVHDAAVGGTGTYTLATSDSTATSATWTNLREWETVSPDANGYAVMEKLPKGVKNYLKLTAVGPATVTAGLVLEQDLDFDLADRDPTAVFDGIVPPQTL